MNWLNLKTTQLREAAFIGSEPVARATWLCVMAYCVELENGGRIPGARLWKDRQWQQTCGVMLSEVQAAPLLLEWVGDDLIVWSYPAEKESEVRVKRENAQKNGKLGGRPKTQGTEEITNEKPTLVTANNQRCKAEGEGKGKENGKEGEVPAEPPPAAPKRAPSDTDEQWLAGIEAKDCYRPVAVRVELGKAESWCEENHRKCTRRFFVNWLNRALNDVRTISPTPGPNGNKPLIYQGDSDI